MPELERVHKTSVEKLPEPKSVSKRKPTGAVPVNSRDVERVFVQRSINAVMELTRLGKSDLLHAISEPTDSGVLLSALHKIAVNQSTGKTPRGQVPTLLQAKLRGMGAMRKLLEAFGGAISVEDAASHLGLTRQGVDKRRRSGQLLAVELGKRGHLYPSWQFTKSGTQKGLAKVLSVLAGQDSWMQLAFFVNPNDRLGGKSPIEALQENRLEEVLAAADAYGKHGAA